MEINKILLTLFSCVQMASLHGQLKDLVNTKVYFFQGRVLQTEEFFKGLNGSGKPINEVRGFGFELGWQSTDSTVYNSLLNYPEFGLGTAAMFFPQTNELGAPNLLYAYMNAPFTRAFPVLLTYDIRIGISYNWHPYNEVNNGWNNAVGSNRNLYIGAGLGLEYSPVRNFDLGLKLVGAHNSNGRSSVPNAGVNEVTTQFFVRYSAGRSRRTFPKHEIPAFKSRGEWFFTLGHGTHQKKFNPDEVGAKHDVSANYSIYNLSLCYQWQTNWSIKYGGGVDVIYNTLVNAGVRKNSGGVWVKKLAPLSERWQLGLYGSFEWVISNLSVYMQPGYRVLRQESYQEDFPDFYQHLAVKYHIKDFILGMGIRATQFQKAEYIEWNIGYRFRR